VLEKHCGFSGVYYGDGARESYLRFELGMKNVDCLHHS
jgi:hypothetical protein